MSFLEKHREKIVFAGPDECWLWTAYRNQKGYGTVASRGKTRKAHREVYEDVHGEGSAIGLLVRHRCDVPACVNPAHLELGTYADNYRDMVVRGRRRVVATKGAAHGRAKLTEADVIAIRSLSGDQTLSQREIAQKFGVNHSIISGIVRRKGWAHV